MAARAVAEHRGYRIFEFEYLLHGTLNVLREVNKEHGKVTFPIELPINIFRP